MWNEKELKDDRVKGNFSEDDSHKGEVRIVL